MTRPPDPARVRVDAPPTRRGRMTEFVRGCVQIFISAYLGGLAALLSVPWLFQFLKSYGAWVSRLFGGGE